MNEWEKRHRDERMRIGRLVPSSNTVMENDPHRHLSKERFTLHTARMFLEKTSAGSSGGPAYDHQVTSELAREAGSPVLGVFSGVWDTLRKSKVRKVLVLTPYINELNSTIADGLEADGIRVQKIVGLGIRSNFSLASPTPDDIVQFALHELSSTVDGIFLSCTNFRALEARAEIAASMRVPLVTSNSAVVDIVLSMEFVS